jgi:hypothetical protein
MITQPKSNPIITYLWALAILAAVINQAVTTVKAALTTPVPQREKTVTEAANRLRNAPPKNGKALVLLGMPQDWTEDSLYFAYRLQYLVYPLRVDRLLFPWEDLDAESYSDIYICDELMLLRQSDVEWHSGTVYKVRTPISTRRIRGGLE